MEKLFSLEYGIGGICVILTISVLVRVAEFVWGLREKKDSLSETTITKLTVAMQENTLAVKHLDCRLETLERSVSDLPKIKTDLRRFYSALKSLSGDRWPAIRDEIMKDDFSL
jgi:hypothetical protein